MPGKGKLTLTGQLGDVMKESATISLSLIRSRLADPQSGFNFMTCDTHIHVPAGATPKDGPSAGVGLFTALASLITGKTVDPELAMTGEITLSGAVMPVGGIKEKVLAAHRAGIKRVILPKENERDLDGRPRGRPGRARVRPGRDRRGGPARGAGDRPAPDGRAPRRADVPADPGAPAAGMIPDRRSRPVPGPCRVRPTVRQVAWRRGTGSHLDRDERGPPAGGRRCPLPRIRPARPAPTRDGAWLVREPGEGSRRTAGLFDCNGNGRMTSPTSSGSSTTSETIPPLFPGQHRHRPSEGLPARNAHPAETISVNSGVVRGGVRTRGLDDVPENTECRPNG